MKHGILIGMAITFALIFSMGAMIKGSGYMYHVRDEDGISSVCVTPGETELYTIAFSTGVKDSDYSLLLIDLDDEDERYPHTGTDDTHIEIVSICTSINANDTFAGDISYGFLSLVSDANSVFHTIDHILYNAYLNSVSRLYADYMFHPIDCRKAETMGFQTTMGEFKSGGVIASTAVCSLETGNGDVVLFVDVGAGNVAVGGVIQYRIVTN